MQGRRRKGRLVSLTEAARVIGRHRGTLSKWIGEGAPAHGESDRDQGVSWSLNVGELVEWLVHRARLAERERLERRHRAEVARLEERLRLATQPEADGPLSLEEGRRREQAAKARLAEFEVGLREGRLVDRHEHDAANIALLSQVRAHLLQVHQKAAAEAHAASSVHECGEIFLRHQCEALQELADAEIVLVNKRTEDPE